MDGSVSPINPRSIPFSMVDPIAKIPEVNEQRTRTSPVMLIASSPKDERDVRKDTLQAVDFANAVAGIFDKKISFRYDERIDQVVVKIVEGRTEEVIRQIPPEELIELVAKLREDFRGLIFDHKG